ncbi:TRAP transporter small permease [Pokkaliibacter sp. MBI-7]|uniref:TRAP transporter small permease n=1 Tax=Pokkaliibacter sp. MBI-7 TaxID=3040600 RepID=UPI00244D5C46|nr:TRAP transporter small permease [Pokkaliibacter sp. MBI-7]MDH2435028.1 TRAP transporter small permease [Pokkaliibacter sp. MBI-7]
MQGYVQAFGNRLNRINERVVGGLMALLLADVWIGVLDRYLFHWQISWVEELARYIMIWAILLAVPCCSVRREHIGLDMLSRHFSARARLLLTVLIDLLTLTFFAYLAFAGTSLVQKGFGQLSSVFGLTMALPYAAIPVSCGLAALQTLLRLLVDLAEVNAARSHTTPAALNSKTH